MIWWEEVLKYKSQLTIQEGNRGIMMESMYQLDFSSFRSDIWGRMLVLLTISMLSMIHLRASYLNATRKRDILC